MKTLLILFFSFLIIQLAEAQVIDPNAAIRRAAERRANRRIEEGANKAIDKTEEGILNSIKKKKRNDQIEEEDVVPSSSKSKKRTSGLEEEDESGSGLEDEGNSVNFKRGAKILYQDDFSKDATGDFPAKWNTTSGGEVKKLKGFDEKYLKVPADALINLEMTKPLPKNFTIEFDMIFPEASPSILAGFGLGKKPIMGDYMLSRDGGYHGLFYSRPDNRENTGLAFGTRYNTESYTLKSNKFDLPLDEKVHVGIMVNNHERIRIYVDGKKRADMPRSFHPDFAKSFFFNGPTSGATFTKTGYFYVSNIIIAETGTDERSQVQKDLIESGEFTTNEILFATNSDKIQSSSFSILKEIGEAMEGAPNMKFMITGHTDSDGDASKNQTLSEKRAAAVKVYLVENFNVKGVNLKTSGKGASDPVASNKTADGKAKNRRVEFSRL